MNKPLGKDFNKVYESFKQNHNYLREKLMASLPDYSKQHKRAGRIGNLLVFTGGTMMKSRLTKLAVAVTIILIIFLHQFNSSINGTSIVWADVAERLEKVSSYKAKADRILTEVGKEEPSFECEILRYFSPNHGSLEESYEDGELVMLAYCSIAEKAAVFVLSDLKMYFRFDLNEELMSLVEYVNPANTDGIMKLFGSERCTRLGSREIDGVRTEGFEVKDVKIFSQVPRFLLHVEDINIRIWVNNETLLPVRVEGEGFFTGLMTLFKKCKYKEVMHSIEYDVEIDESIFDPNIPEDYILIDPANITQKAELVMLCILPFSIVAISYEHFKKITGGSIKVLRRIKSRNSR
jgi:outer membrane lipoprotein-sorting protein